MNKQKKKLRYRIGIMGVGSRGRGSKIVLKKARILGKEIVKQNCILVTGACWAAALEASLGAEEENGLVLAFSPGATLKEHLEYFKYPPLPSSCIPIFTGCGKEGRNVISIRTCDAVILISGRIGTLNEFSIAYQLGKVIGVLENTGGISDKIRDIIKACKKDTGAEIIYHKDPKTLVRKVINVLGKR